MKKMLSKDNIYSIIILCSFAIIYRFIFDLKLDLNGDNFNYLNYATSMFKGYGYSSPYSASLVPVNHFPPGYSSLLASFMLIFGNNIIVFKILNGLFYFLSIYFLYKILNKLTSNMTFSFSVSMLLVFNSELMRFSTIVMSEIPYLFFSVIAIYFMIKDSLSDGYSKDKPWCSVSFYATLLFSVVAYYFRGVGLTLFFSLFVFWLFQKKYRYSVMYLLGVVVLYLPWYFRNKSLGLSSRYIDTMFVVNNWRPEEGKINTIGGFIHKFGQNFYDTVIKGFSQVAFPGFNISNTSVFVVWAWGILILLFVIYGALKIVKYRWFFLSYVVSNIGIFLLWHGGNGARYVRPLAPFICILFFWGLYNVILYLLKSKNKGVTYIPYLFMLFALFNIAQLKYWNKYAQANYNPAFENYFNLAKVMKKNGVKDKVVCCRKPGMFYYFYESYVCNYKNSLDDKLLIEDLKQHDVKFVVLDQLGYSSTSRYLYPAIKKNPDNFKLCYKLKNPDTYLLFFK